MSVATAAATSPALVAAMTCFNRRDKTLACLHALRASAARAGVPVAVVLVDDGSTDGTADAVRATFPEATVLPGGGQLFWCRGMHLAMAHADTVPATHVLWLNDDTTLAPHAIGHLLAQERLLREREGREVIVVGATQNDRGERSYGGGVSLGGLRPLRYRAVGGGPEPERCDVMNGNCVLLSRAVVKVVGNLDPAFEHAMGDTDYALRAWRAGVAVYVAAGFVGHCNNNPVQGTAGDGQLSLRERWRAMQSRKGLPWRSWLHFTRRHGGWLWPLRFALPYAKLLFGPQR